MREKEILERAFAMPLTSPAYPPGPYRFVNREYLIISYRTDPARLRAVVPEPLEIDAREALVKYEFIRMPDSNGFGDYTESGQVIPVTFRGHRGGYTHCMFLNDEGPIAGGRELWGFPKKLAQPTLRTEVDTLVGTAAAGCNRYHGLQAPRSRHGASQSRARGTEFPAQDHSRRRWQPAHL
jgi:acetoacetate decarboxylase